jgi:hypothetical protein
MNDQAMQQTINPLYVMDDEELVSRLILARDNKKINDFLLYRRELMHRLRCSHLRNWTPPQRFTDGKATGKDDE